MNVLVDRHHHALFHSMQMLFEDRLGGLVFTPIGHDWWDEGYWLFGINYGDDRLARQFLNEAPFQDTDVNVTYDGHHPERPIWGVTLSEAKRMKWDYVVATVQDNQYGFARFAKENGATYVLQVGNTNQSVDWSLDPLAIVTSEVPVRGRGVVVHQEFDATGIFGYRDPLFSGRTIRSFVNCFDSTGCYRSMEAVRELLPDVRFGIHGIDGADGNIETVTGIAELMAGSAFGWHDKVQGDGFGHVIHNWAAIGRPLIGHGQHYRGLMAEPFWVDGVTCIDLDKHSPGETAQLIRDILADPDRHREMCMAIREVFDRTVDLDADARKVADLLGLGVPA